MKKFLTVLCVALFFGITNSVFAATTDWSSSQNLTRVNDIGTKIMIANNLPRGIMFRVSNQDIVNAYANINKEVYVYAGLLKYVETNDELAAIISHELGHIVNGHCAKQTLLNAGIASLAKATAQNTNTAGTVAVVAGQQLATSKISRSDEFEADLTGVDLMIKAGYNPLAMISVLNKISGNYFDAFETHPSGEKRLMNIYDYISYNYPDKIQNSLATTSYKNALNIIDANVAVRKANPKEMRKYENAQAKLKANKIKRAKKIKNSVNAWDASYTVLNLLSN